MTVATFTFDASWELIPGAILIGLVLVMMARDLAKRGLERSKMALLLGLRSVALILLLFLAARPVTVRSHVRSGAPYVAVLLDRSESMSLEETKQTRFAQATHFLKEELAPAFQSEGWKVHPWLFADKASLSTAEDISVTEPNGPRTDLAGAIVQSLQEGTEPPIAVVALTDGSANDTTQNTNALSSLIQTQTPFYGIGYGSDEGPATLNLQKATAPTIVAVKQEFHVSAQLSFCGTSITDFDLILSRDGQLLQHKKVAGFTGSRTWSEAFGVSEEAEGRHNYTIEVSPPNLEKLIVGKNKDSVEVKISNEKDLRILFVQGILTWDYKFISLAVRTDPALRLTGLSQTSDHSVYRQNVEKSGELIDGFPTTLEQIAPYRVVVISNLKPATLNETQQQVLTRFCGELGGGVLMIGGPGTFDASWQGSTLEKLMPVTFDPNPGVELDQPFHLKLSDDALRQPVFQLGTSAETQEAWDSLPAFNQYGRVDRAKPGAVIWAYHESDIGPNGKRILMAEQNYGAGRSAVICLQNFWKWRLAKESDPKQFDRFWRQLFRYMGDYGRQSVIIDFADQQLDPPTDIHMTLERHATPSDFSNATPTPTPAGGAPTFAVIIHDPDQKEVLHQDATLPINQAVPVVFHAQKEGVYEIEIQDSLHIVVSERSLQLQNTRLEMQQTARDMENLKQWASLTQGQAFKSEELLDPGPLLAAIHKHLQSNENASSDRMPWGIQASTLFALLGMLCVEWVLRKQWNLL